MADPERFKRQSPVTTDSPTIKCTTLYSDFNRTSGYRKRDCYRTHAKLSLQQSSNIVFTCAVAVWCRNTTWYKLIILRMSVIVDFEQRWRQRGKTVDWRFIAVESTLTHW